MTSIRAYSAGQFALVIDGKLSTAYVKSAEGGFIKQNVADEGAGGMVDKVKHGTTREIDPIQLEIAMAQADSLIKWIQDSWKQNYSRKDGALLHADYNYKVQFHQEFTACLIEEVTFPALDAGSKDMVVIKVKLRPEAVTFGPGDKTSIKEASRDKAKVWSAAAFRLVIDGKQVEGVNKIDSFTIKQGIKPVSVGNFEKLALPQLEPTSVTFPDLTITQSLSDATDIFNWYSDVIVKRKVNETKGQHTGAIEFLDTSKKKVIFRINLAEVGIKSFKIPKSESGADGIKRCVFELYVGSMAIDDADNKAMAIEF